MHARAAEAPLPFPARTGESGLLDVPDSETVPVGIGRLGFELRFDDVSGQPAQTGPLPLYVVGGLTDRLEMGLTMREWGSPGDPVPERMLYGSALKLKLLDGHGRAPSVAVDATLDRFNTAPVIASRLIVSTPAASSGRFSAFAGYGAGFASSADSGPVFGAAAGFVPYRSTEVVLEALGSPHGANLGLALRWKASPTYGLQLGFNYHPKEGDYRISLGVAVGARPRARHDTETPSLPAAQGDQETAARLAFTDDRPRFRLRIDVGPQRPGEGRHLQHGPPTIATATASAAAPAPQRVAAPSVDQVAAAHLAEAEAANDARQRSLSATAEALAARDASARSSAGRLGARENELAAREARLDQKEGQLRVRGPVPADERQVQSREAQLAYSERQLTASARSLQPTIDAAQGRADEATRRELLEQTEADRVTALAAQGQTPTEQLETRKLALAARQRQFASAEARLVAHGERLDALERQLRTREEQLDARQRRLDARAERLDLMARRASSSRTATASVDSAAPLPSQTTSPATQDKAVFVMVVKSPTAILKSAANTAGGASRSASEPPGTPRPDFAVEKAVAAATVVSFATPTSQLDELDRETVAKIARLAVAERCDVLVWARAKDPSLMPEAQRRAEEIKRVVMKAAQLDESRITTRITTRPGARGVDVVISALCSGGTPQRTEAGRASPTATAAGAPRAQLGEGEAAKRQIRDAVVAVKPKIEECVSATLQRRNLSRAEGVLKLGIDRRGKVVSVHASGSDLEGNDLASCLLSSSSEWVFPAAEADYAVDVPVTIVQEGRSR